MSAIMDAKEVAKQKIRQQLQKAVSVEENPPRRRRRRIKSAPMGNECGPQSNKEPTIKDKQRNNHNVDVYLMPTAHQPQRRQSYPPAQSTTSMSQSLTKVVTHVATKITAKGQLTAVKEEAYQERTFNTTMVPRGDSTAYVPLPARSRETAKKRTYLLKRKYENDLGYTPRNKPHRHRHQAKRSQDYARYASYGYPPSDYDSDVDVDGERYTHF